MAGTQGYDGTIRINTSLNPDGLNKGTKDIAKSTSSSLGSLMGTIKKLALTIGFLFTTEKIISFVRTAIQSFDIMGSSFGAKITELKTAFETLKGAIVNALLSALVALMPYILMAIDGFTKFLTIVAQVITVLTGAAVAQQKLAGATNAAGKAAKGALASFDQLNVLQKPAEDTTAALPGVPVVSPEMIAQIEAFKAKLMEFLQPAIDAFGRLQTALAPLGKTIWEGLKWAWDNILVPFGNWVMTEAVPAFLDLVGQAGLTLNEALIALQPAWQWFWDNVLKPAAEWTGQAIIDGLKWLTDRLKELGEWIKANPETFRNLVIGLTIAVAALAGAWWLANAAISAWNVLSLIASASTGLFAAAMAFLASPVVIIFLAILLLIGAVIDIIIWWKVLEKYGPRVWEIIKEAWSNAGEWFTQNVTEPIGSAFRATLDFIQWAWEDVFGGIGRFVKGTINTIIDYVNGMVQAVMGGINAVIAGLNSIKLTVPNWVPLFGGASFGVNINPLSVPQIPRLATGAVIPPNAQFAAILGDQRNGTNIEAPESLIRQIVSEEIGKIQADIHIAFDGNMAALVRELNPHITRENVRIGGSLIKSGTVL